MKGSCFSLENTKGSTIPLNSLSSPHALIGGVAYGGYARKVNPFIFMQIYLISSFILS